MFANSWSFNHVASSPRYPQSNGKAENAVRTVKRLFEKCKETGVPEFQALLDWRNTPSEGMETSPAQRLMGRRCRTLLPTSESLLRPSYPLCGDVRALAGRKWGQKNYYDRHVKSLKPINLGTTVRVRLPGEKVCSPAECVGFAGPRSYLVKTGDAVYRRNRRDLKSTGKPPITDNFDSSVSPQSSRSNAESPGVASQ